MTVFCYDRCTTCKKALKWLDDCVPTGLKEAEWAERLG